MLSFSGLFTTEKVVFVIWVVEWNFRPQGDGRSGPREPLLPGDRKKSQISDLS